MSRSSETYVIRCAFDPKMDWEHKSCVGGGPSMSAAQAVAERFATRSGWIRGVPSGWICPNCAYLIFGHEPPQK